MLWSSQLSAPLSLPSRALGVQTWRAGVRTPELGPELPAARGAVCILGGGKPSQAAAAFHGAASCMPALGRALMMSPTGSVDGHLLDWSLLGNGKEDPPPSSLRKLPETCVCRGQKPSSPMWWGGCWELGSRTAGPRSSMARGHRIILGPLHVHPPGSFWRRQRARMLPQTQR